MVPGDHELTLKGCFLEPSYCFLKLRETTLIREIASMDQHIAQRKFWEGIVGVRDANEARPTESRV